MHQPFQREERRVGTPLRHKPVFVYVVVVLVRVVDLFVGHCAAFIALRCARARNVNRGSIGRELSAANDGTDALRYYGGGRVQQAAAALVVVYLSLALSRCLSLSARLRGSSNNGRCSAIKTTMTRSVFTQHPS